MKRLTFLASLLLFAPLCIGGNIAGLLGGKPAAAAGPTLSSATIDSAGTTMTLVFSGTVARAGAGSEPTLVNTAGASGTSPSNPTLSYVSGDATNTWTYTISRAINLTAVETSALSYTTGNRLTGVGTITSQATTNNSTAQTYTARIDQSALVGADKDIGSGSTNVRLGGKMTTSGAFVLTKIGVKMYKNNSPTGNIAMTVFSDSAGVPSTSLVATSNSVDATTLPASIGLVDFTMGTVYSMGASTVYWVMGHRDTSNGTNYINIGMLNDTNLAYFSSESVSWTSAGTRDIGAVLYSSPSP